MKFEVCDLRSSFSLLCVLRFKRQRYPRLFFHFDSVSRFAVGGRLNHPS